MSRTELGGDALLPRAPLPLQRLQVHLLRFVVF
jgi:hypothetical protein